MFILELIWGGPKSIFFYDAPKDYTLYFIFTGFITVLAWVLAFTYPLVPASEELAMLVASGIDTADRPLGYYILVPAHKGFSYAVLVTAFFKTLLFTYHVIRRD